MPSWATVTEYGDLELRKSQIRLNPQIQDARNLCSERIVMGPRPPAGPPMIENGTLLSAYEYVFKLWVAGM